MLRPVLVIILLIGVVPAVTGQDGASPQPPIVSLILPPGIPSETAQIHYFMTGPFGGYGDSLSSEKGRRTYEIIASVDGKSAESVKVIAYLPGCQIETLEIQVRGTTPSRALSCKPLGRTTLHGQISPASIVQEQPSQVQVDYLATWDHKFFSIADGMVTDIRLASIVPDASGQFYIELPDFHQQTNLGEGELQFTLIEANTGYILAFLSPTDGIRNSRRLAVRAPYAPVIQLMAERIH